MSNPDSPLPLNVYRNLCRAEEHVLERRWSDADQCFATAVAADRSPASRITFAISLAYRERYYDAICQLTAALDLASESGDRDALGVVYHNLAAIYRELEDFDLARRFQQRAIQQVDECGCEELLGLSNDAWQSGRPKLAECLATSATELCQADVIDVESPEAHATVGVMTGVQGDPRNGIRRLIWAYRQHHAASAHRLMGIDLLNLSVLFGKCGHHQREISSVRGAIRCFEHATASHSAKRAQEILARLLRANSIREFDASRN